jgi:hypothetical protein
MAAHDRGLHYCCEVAGGTTLVAGAVDQHVAIGLPDRAAAHTGLRRRTARLTAQFTAALATVRLASCSSAAGSVQPPSPQAPAGAQAGLVDD